MKNVQFDIQTIFFLKRKLISLLLTRFTHQTEANQRSHVYRKISAVDLKSNGLRPSWSPLDTSTAAQAVEPNPCQRLHPSAPRGQTRAGYGPGQQSKPCHRGCNPPARRAAPLCCLHPRPARSHLDPQSTRRHVGAFISIVQIGVALAVSAARATAPGHPVPL